MELKAVVIYTQTCGFSTQKQWLFSTEAVVNYIQTCGLSMPKQCTFDHEEP